ncbi:MAG: peptide-methionine (S)-S-oxide reductase MsrA [Hahellaceae bacterium]|nr:peptide-methionine (S)-S-oxide reductase MsrA [Hahellaceae bacterium]
MFGVGSSCKDHMVEAERALPGREQAISVPESHYVLNTPLVSPYPEYTQVAMFGLGCFWGAERKFWQVPGVYTTAVGYAAGYTPNPTYEEVCTGLTGHNETVLVVFDPNKVSYEQLLAVFWESHNPTQGMRQGNDRGTQYRSGIYCSNETQVAAARQSMSNYQQRLNENGITAPITTEILNTDIFYFAEGYHQQYLAKNPGGYCGLGGTGVCY